MFFKYAELNGKGIAFTDESEFRVQLGRGRSAYRTKWTFKGNLSQAVLFYNALNIGNGFKKRLVFVNAKKPILARAFS